ncbi:flagellar basal-body MS-ring/collar protein FliF [Virgisporangium aurantiacum]|uniref:Flagellar M-ring protein n=1 Tax=Virgisporangium aurantiacum TaxID=175570 RepID=A0A8J4DXX9_9ACTN|nr:flagellar basal-body MS-ring/collar protein FliF [Virgisporangium aurantiacum]GIJ52512.1 flagellar M-ring protein [Virgisporangium aurantiacum]
MKDRLTAALRSVTGKFGSFTPGQKAVSIVAVIAIAVGGYFFATWVSKPTYSPLFSNLASSDAAAIVEQLDADGVPYELTDGGNTILVPKDQVYSLRLQMSGQGLPADTSNGGYSILDNQNVMTSEFMQQVGYRRAMEGELANTIKSIDGVTAATVHLAIPQKDVFTDEQQKPTASVLVATGAGKELTDDQVQAVVHLVSSSIEGLEPSAVTVVGADGKVLSANGSGSGGTSSDSRARATSDYESRLNAAVQRMLDQALGSGNAVVQISADLDFDNTETKSRKYSATPNMPPVAENTKTEKYSGGNGAPVGGVLGPDNVQVPVNNDSAGGGSYEQSEATRNNAVDVTDEVRRSAPGAVKKLSIAVMINSDAVQGANEAQLQQLISSAVGLDPTRGDSIAVSAMAFDTSGAEAAQRQLEQAQAADKNAALMSMIKTGATIFGVVLLILIALLGNRRRNKKLKKMLQAEIERFEAEQAELESRQMAALSAGTGAAGALTAGSGSDAEALARAERARDITALVERQPDEVATLLRTWLADRRG